jgi:hypothetical protein
MKYNGVIQCKMEMWMGLHSLQEQVSRTGGRFNFQLLTVDVQEILFFSCKVCKFLVHSTFKPLYSF